MIAHLSCKEFAALDNLGITCYPIRYDLEYDIHITAKTPHRILNISPNIFYFQNFHPEQDRGN
jgi:hypothetical protein